MARRRIMVIMKETNGWMGEINPVYDTSITPYKGMLFYDEMINREGIGRGNINWRICFDIRNSARENGNDIIFNNIGKIGKQYGNPGFPGKVNEYASSFLKMEIENLRPELILFLCGHSYDKYIEQYLGAYTAEPVSDLLPASSMARLTFDSPLMGGIEVIRTYHPFYLNVINRKTGILDHISEIVKNY